MADDDLKNQNTGATPNTPHSVVPDNDEYYTLNLDRDDDNDEKKAAFDIASSNDDTSVIGSSSVYDGTIVTEDDDDDSSSQVGKAGHSGIDEDTE